MNCNDVKGSVKLHASLDACVQFSFQTWCALTASLAASGGTSGLIFRNWLFFVLSFF